MKKYDIFGQKTFAPPKQRKTFINTIKNVIENKPDSNLHNPSSNSNKNLSSSKKKLENENMKEIQQYVKVFSSKARNKIIYLEIGRKKILEKWDKKLFHHKRAL